MQAIEFKGFWGLILLLLIALLTLSFVLLVPSVLATVIWNALVFEFLRGPEINLMQGALLWFALMLVLYSLLQPELVFEMHASTEPELPASKTKPAKPKKKQLEQEPENKEMSTHWQQWRNRIDKEKH